MALTPPSNDIHMTTQGQAGERLDRRTTFYSGVSLNDFSTAHFGDNYCVHYHYHDPCTQAIGPSESRANQSVASKAVNVESPAPLPPPAEEQGEWLSLLKKKLPCKAFVTLPDQDRDDKSIANIDPACDVELQVMGDNLITNCRRRLAITWKNPQREAEHLWLPGTHINIARQGLVIGMNFSDCKQMANPTTDYLNNYTAVYEPSTPNVAISLECSDEHLAAKLEAHLLYYTGPATSERDCKTKLSEDYTVRLDSMKCINGEALGWGLCVWTSITDPQTGQRCTHLDLGCFTPQTDFELDVANDTFSLCIQQFMKIHYVPIDVGKNPYWPPDKVKRNSSGAPAYMRISLNPNDNALTVKSLLDQSKTLLSETIGRAWDAQARDWFILDYIVNLHTISIRNKEEQGQLTIWEKEEYLYGLLRKVDRPDNKRPTSSHDKDGESSGQIWRTIRWRRHGPYSEIHSTGDTTTSHAVESIQGNYLSMSNNGTEMFEPQNRDASPSVIWEEVKISFKFGSKDEMHRFARLLQ